MTDKEKVKAAAKIIAEAIIRRLVRKILEDTYKIACTHPDGKVMEGVPFKFVVDEEAETKEVAHKIQEIFDS